MTDPEGFWQQGCSLMGPLHTTPPHLHPLPPTLLSVVTNNHWGERAFGSKDAVYWVHYMLFFNTLLPEFLKPQESRPNNAKKGRDR